MKVHKHRHITSDGTEIDLTVKSRGFDWGIVPAVLFFLLLAVMAVGGIMEAPAAQLPFTRVAPVSAPIPWGTIILSGALGALGIVMLLVGGVLLLARLQEREERKGMVGMPIEVPSRKMTEKRTDDAPAPMPGKVVPLRRVS